MVPRELAKGLAILGTNTPESTVENASELDDIVP